MRENSPLTTCALALGFFDGVHLGHGALLRKTAELAARHGIRACALTFDVHPDLLLLGRAQYLLSTMTDRETLMREYYGIDSMLVLPFTRQLMKTLWETFVRDVIIGRLNARYVVSGHDYHFGYRGEGNSDRLACFCRAFRAGTRLESVSVAPVLVDGIPVSSTYIRRLIAQGDMIRAGQFLGHPHRLTGVVQPGRGVGASLGAPTTNIPLPELWQWPLFGVYLTKIRILETECGVPGHYVGVTNVGLRPTFGVSTRPVAETVIFGFHGNLYGREITLEFIDFLRPEQSFSTIESLRLQIHEDLAAARNYWKRAGYDVMSLPQKGMV